MRRLFVLLALLLCANVLAICQANAAINIATVAVGNPGNANDSYTGGTYGGVTYNYSIGKYDVTVGQYAAFLNAVAKTDTYGLYSTFMTSDQSVASISRSGSPGNYTYSVIGSTNHPITYADWGDAARFANWLTNGQPTGLQGLGTTETGSYTLNGAMYLDLNAVTRNSNAAWVIPSENEWYKAAYYNPAAGNYFQRAFSSNSDPISAPPGNAPNTANFYDPTTGYAVTGSTTLSNSQNYLTDVGAYTASASPYGAFDMGGEVKQWNEAYIIYPGSTYRCVRGGTWGTQPYSLDSFYRTNYGPAYENSNIGFRMAFVPEPSSAVLACKEM
jgi:sulfatase modifying factor 1